MIFQKASHKNFISEEIKEEEMPIEPQPSNDDVDTVVGPSVNVEGDFASEGNIIVKGTVTGSVHTSKFLTVELGAKILANVRAGNAKISGEVKGNMKVKEVLELTASAKVLGDVEIGTLIVEAGAVLYGKVAMTGVNLNEGGKPMRVSRSSFAKRLEEMPVEE